MTEPTDSNQTDQTPPNTDKDFFASYKKILKTYIEQKYELAKLTLVEKIAILGGLVFSTMLIVLMVLLLLIFLSITAGFGLSMWMGSYVIGFGMIAVIYFVLCILLFANKTKIEKSVVNLLIRLMLNDKN